MGCGGWAKVPWLAVSDTSESTQHGLYLQYLIRADCTAVHFCLGQGTTKLKKLFGGAAASRHLRHVGEYVRKRCRTLLGDDSPFDLEGEISLGAGSNSLADGYEKASIVSRTYTIGALPDEATLLAELRQLLAAYAAVLSDAEYIDGIKKPVDQQIADAERQKREAEAAAKSDSRLVVAAAPAGSPELYLRTPTFSIASAEPALAARSWPSAARAARRAAPSMSPRDAHLAASEASRDATLYKASASPRAAASLCHGGIVDVLRLLNRCARGVNHNTRE